MAFLQKLKKKRKLLNTLFCRKVPHFILGDYFCAKLISKDLYILFIRSIYS